MTVRKRRQEAPMNKSGLLGMKLHQTLSFHPLLMHIPKTEAVFWPGCALMNLDPALLEKTLSVLKRKEPDIRLAAGCCGQPTVFLFPEKEKKRREKLLRLLKEQGVKRIYTACPNCTVQLKNLDGFEILPIWPVLSDCLTASDLKETSETFLWHDPCPTRKDQRQQEAARKLLALSGCQYQEPEHTGPETRCCGNFHMMRATDPEKSETIRKRRLAEFPKDLTIVSNCEGCLTAFGSEGRNVLHLLELLFGASKARGWKNRIKITLHTKTGII